MNSQPKYVSTNVPFHFIQLNDDYYFEDELTITKTNFAAQVCHDQCPVRCRGPPQEPTQKREPLHTTGECDDDDDEYDHYNDYIDGHDDDQSWGDAGWSTINCLLITSFTFTALYLCLG